MLSNTLYRVACEPGLKLLQKRGEGGAGEVTSWRLYLEDGKSTRYINANEETVLVLRQGAGTLSAGGPDWRVKRSDVFTERATALYLPPLYYLWAMAGEQRQMALYEDPAHKWIR